MRVLTISGSLRPDSLNTLLLRAAEEQAPAGVRELREQIEAADAVLIATPEYNGSIPGVLKNALDWVSTPFPDNVLRGKPVAVIGASTGGYGGMWAQAELRKVLGLTGARVVNGDLSLARAHEHFNEAGTLAAPHDTRLSEVLDSLLAEVQPVAA